MALIPLEEYLRKQQQGIMQQFPQFAMPQQQAPEGPPSLIGGPLKRGALGVGSNLLNVAGTAADFVGADEYAQGWFEKADELAQARDDIPRRVPRVEDISGLKDLGVFAIETLAENAPLLATIAIPGGVATTGARVLAGAGLRGAQATGAVTAFLADVGLQTGESVEIARQEGKDPNDIRVIGSGIGKGALDFVPLLTIAKRIGLLKNLPLGSLIEKTISERLVNGGFISRAAGEAGTIIAREVPTEVAQEYINIALKRALTEYGGDLTDEEKSQLLNAAAGAAAFGLLGIPAAIGRPADVEQTDRLYDGDLDIEGATNPDDTPPLLPGPRPEVFTVTPEGEVIPFSLADESPGAANLRASVAQALEGSPEPRAQAVVFRPDGGTEVNYGPDGLQYAVMDTTRIPAIQRSDIDNAVMQIGQMREQGKQREKKTSTVVKQAVAESPLPATMQKLVDARAEVLVDPKYQRKDGQLNAAGKKRVAGIEARIDKLASTLGIANPTAEKTLEDSTNIEEDIQKFNKEEEVQSLLAPGERKLLEKLQEKDTFEGLSDREYEQYERLLAKARGEERATREKRSKAEIAREKKELERIAKEELENETTRPRYSKGKVIDIRGILQRRRVQRMAKLEVELAEHIRRGEEELAGLEALVEKLRVQIVEETRGYRRLHRWQTDSGSKSIAAFYGSPNFIHALAAIKVLPEGQFQAIVPGRNQEISPIFSSLEEAQQYAEGLIEDVRFSIREYNVGGIRPDPKYSPQQVLEIAHKMMKGFKNAPDLIVTRSAAAFRNIPNKRMWANEPDRVEGMFFPSEPDAIYLFSDLMQSEAHIRRVLLHETMHRGLYNFMPAKDLARLLNLLSKYDPRVRARLEATVEGQIQLAWAEKNDVFARMAVVKEMALQAEEIIAEMAESDPRASLLDRVIALIRSALRKVMPNLKVTNAELRAVIGDVGAYGRKTTQNLRQNLSTNSARFSRSAFTRMTGRTKDVLDDVIPGVESASQVWGQRFLNGVLTPLQIARRYDSVVPSAKTYLETVQRWWARKRTLTNEPVGITEDWSRFGKRDAQRISRVLFEVQDRSQELGRRLTMQEVKEEMVKAGLDPDKVAPRGGRNIYQIWKDVDESFRKVLDQMQIGLQKLIIRQGVRDGVAAEALYKDWIASPDHAAFMNKIAENNWENLGLGARLLEVENQIKAMKERNYFPLMRFGKWAITVRAKKEMFFEGKDYKAGDVIWFETHERPGQQINRAEELARGQFGRKDNFEMQISKLSDNEFTFLGMPPALYETLKGKLGLSKDQEERLKEIYFKFSPGRSFLKHMVQRKGIAGFSTDAMRIYASYMMNASNHLARVEFHQELGDNLEAIRADAIAAPDSNRAGVIRDYFAKHYDYIMNPTNDLARIRAMGFLWYLGANVKSALVNLTQVPMVAYPYLSSTYGDVKTTAAIFKAYGDTTKFLRGKKLLDPEIDADIKRAIAEGFVDEALVTEIAGIAEGDILNIMAPEGTSARVLNRASYYGSFLFRHAEKFNRITTFIAARNLAKEAGIQGEELYKAARDAVQTTMFEYAKWNRPEFMRGKKSVFFLFWQYMQHLSFLAYGGEGKNVAMRQWLMLMAVAGAQGLPFAENFFDIFDWSATEIKELFGVKDPRTSIRDDIRELAATLIDEPDLIMHGLSRHYGLGPLHLLSLLDVPVPRVDISGSLGTGEILPGLSEAFRAESDPDKKMGRIMVDALGPVVGMGYNLWRVLEDDNPDTWKRWERALPTAIQNASKALRRGERGEESFRGGGAIVKFDPQNMEHRVENIAQALGFAPSRLNERQEMRYSQESLRQYWTTRRAVLIESYAYSLIGHDSEAMDRALKKIRAFNKEVPAAQLAIHHETLRRSVEERFRRRSLREAGAPNELAFVPLYRSIEKLYPGGSDAVPR